MISVGTRLNRGLFSSVRGDWATPQQLMPHTFDITENVENMLHE